MVPGRRGSEKLKIKNMIKKYQILFNNKVNDNS